MFSISVAFLDEICMRTVSRAVIDNFNLYGRLQEFKANEKVSIAIKEDNSVCVSLCAENKILHILMEECTCFLMPSEITGK